MAIGTGGAWKDNTSDFAKMYMNQPWTAEQDSPPVDLIPSEGQMTYEDNKHRIYYDGEWHDVEIGVDQGDQGSHNHTHWMSVEPNDHGNNGNNVTWTYSTADAEIEELKEIIKMLAELVKPYAKDDPIMEAIESKIEKLDKESPYSHWQKTGHYNCKKEEKEKGSELPEELFEI